MIAWLDFFAIAKIRLQLECRGISPLECLFSKDLQRIYEVKGKVIPICGSDSQLLGYIWIKKNTGPVNREIGKGASYPCCGRTPPMFFALRRTRRYGWERVASIVGGKVL